MTLPANLTYGLFLGMAVYFVFRFVCLSLSLYAMLKLQDLNYTIPGLLISAALTSLCCMIPFVGSYLGTGVLYFCVRKLTESEFIDIRFTVAVSYAAMFMLQMMVLSAVPVNARAFKDALPVFRQENFADAGFSQDGAAKSNKKTDSHFGSRASLNTNTSPTPTVATNAPRPKVAMDYEKNWKLKGVIGTGHQATAMIGVGGKTYTLGVGEKLTIDTGKGDVDVSMETAAQTYILLNVDGEKVTLSLQ